MKRLLLLVLPFMFFITKAQALEQDSLFKYDETISIIYNADKISIERNEIYYLTYCKLYEDSNYFEELEKENIKNKSLDLRTDSKNEKISFQSEKMDFGTVYYAKIVNNLDDYIYYMSFPATKEMNENKEQLFKLVKEKDFNKLNIYYEDIIEDEIKDDFDGIYYVDSENLVSYDEILNNIKAVDNNDGTLDNVEILYDGYTNQTKIGDYYMEFKSTDSSGNVSKYRLLVKIVDITSPKIESKSFSKRIETTNKKHLSYNDLLDLVTVRDNCSKMDGRIRIIKNEYFRNESVNGEYKVTFYAEDLYGNSSTFDMYIGVGKNNTIYEIDKYESDNLTAKNACDLYFQSLGINPYYEITSDLYTGNEHSIGSYEIGVSYDLNGLKYAIIKVNVIEHESNETTKNEKKFNFLWIIILTGTLIVGGIIIFVIKKIKHK